MKHSINDAQITFSNIFSGFNTLTFTDSNGQFSIDLPNQYNNYELIISSLGHFMEMTTLNIEDWHKRRKDFTLQSDGSEIPKATECVFGKDQRQHPFWRAPYHFKQMMLFFNPSR